MHNRKLLVLMRVGIGLAVFSGLILTPIRSVFAATLTVNSLADTNDSVCSTAPGGCTLREAINAANNLESADTILFNLSGIITLTSSLPWIIHTGGALTIDGANRDIKISGDDKYPVFFINTGAELTLLNLEVRDGYASVAGGGIYNRGALTIRGCTLVDNRADEEGGAIYTDGPLTISDSSFSGNTVDVANGGAIYIYDGEVNITNGYFQDNRAACSGGAIHNHYEGEYEKGELVIQGTEFFMNLASGCDGGAIYADSDTEIYQSFFALNGSYADGGAIYVDGATASIEQSVFNINYSNYGNGGAVYIDNISHTVVVEDCTFYYNQAMGGDGGGFYLERGHTYFIRSLFKNNEAEGNGGGSYNYLAQLNIDNCTFYDNQASYGGGIYTDGTSSTFIESSTFSSNSATVAGGGGGIFGGTSTLVSNSIVANSTSGGNCDDTSPYPFNNFNNIDSGTTCHWMSSYGSMSSTNPLLGPLKDNGGYTNTMALLPGSPAMDGVDYSAPNGCPDNDQRGFPRPYGAYCDIGAVEQYFRALLPVVIKN
jgi:CSLREA domain-containing protein